ncbi:MAG: L-serine ammonia-lyase, iron-sulfur-dependent, subunit alpha [Bacillota bacterium]
MDNHSTIYQAYLHILKEELIPAMGCTEPIAIAYCAAIARKTLGITPEKVEIEVSGNIIKNVKSVVIPNTNGLKGIEAAAVAGIIAGDEAKTLEVISHVSDIQKKQIAAYLNTACISVKSIQGNEPLDITVQATSGEHTAKVRLAGTHTNIVFIQKDQSIIYQVNDTRERNTVFSETDLLNINDICDFADTVQISDIKDILERQIEFNTAIAEEGLRNSYGANIGKVLLRHYGNDITVRARAVAAAGSDARMSGCEMPVVINSGSGNQGITVSLPVIEYSKELGSSREKLYRALVISNLCAIHQKSVIGRLGAYCGAINAGCGAGAGIAYLHGGGMDAIAHTIVNALAITSGIVCDGAKPSCAGKIATAVEAGILGYLMYHDGYEFRGGEGIISKGVENTIRNVGRLGRDGMKETDKEIIRIMMGC